MLTNCACWSWTKTGNEFNSIHRTRFYNIATHLGDGSMFSVQSEEAILQSSSIWPPNFKWLQFKERVFFSSVAATGWTHCFSQGFPFIRPMWKIESYKWKAVGRFSDFPRSIFWEICHLSRTHSNKMTNSSTMKPPRVYVGWRVIWKCFSNAACRL